MKTGLIKRVLSSSFLFGIIWGSFESGVYLLKEPALKSSFLVFIAYSIICYSIIFCIISFVTALSYRGFKRKAVDDRKEVASLFASCILFIVILFLFHKQHWDIQEFLSPTISDIVMYVIFFVGIVFIFRILTAVIHEIVTRSENTFKRRTIQVGNILLFIFIGFCFVYLVGLDLTSRFSHSSDSSRPNVVLVLLDTLRADHLGCYDYAKNTSPTIDRLAEDGITFEAAISQYPASLGSHASLFTALYPNSHCTYEHSADSFLNMSFTTLAERFKEAGYQTIAILDNPWVSNKTGLAQGFDTFINRETIEKISPADYYLLKNKLILPRYYYTNTNQMNLTTRLGTQWLNGLVNKKPFFLFLHYITIHYPYDPPAEYASKFVVSGGEEILQRSPQVTLQKFINDHAVVDISSNYASKLVGLYDAEIAYTDHELSLFLDCLEENKEKESTVIVITSDHGEGLDSHKPHFYEHGDLYDAGIKVPLIFYYDKWDHKGKRIQQPVELIDLYPTLLDIAGIDDYSEAIEGQSLMPLIDNEDYEGEQYTFSQVRTNSFAIRSSDWKLIERNDGQKNYELYNLRDDPGERKDLIHSIPEVAEGMLSYLENWKKSLSCYYENHRRGKEFDEDLKEELKALGYLH